MFEYRSLKLYPLIQRLLCEFFPPLQIDDIFEWQMLPTLFSISICLIVDNFTETNHRQVESTSGQDMGNPYDSPMEL